VRQRDLDDLPGVDAGLSQRATEELRVMDQTKLRNEEESNEYLEF